MHSLNIIHRDIKPKNILIGDNGTLKLCDFGWSNYNEFARYRYTFCGTPEYMAPEMISLGGHDNRLDIWNLGILLHEMLTGKTPFNANWSSAIYDNILLNKVKYADKYPKAALNLT